VIGSLVAYHAEHPVNPEFATVGDALWRGIVTVTTVGYGDIVPKTTTGRWVATPRCRPWPLRCQPSAIRWRPWPRG